MEGTSLIQKEGINHTKRFQNLIVCFKKKKKTMLQKLNSSLKSLRKSLLIV